MDGQADRRAQETQMLLPCFGSYDLSQNRATQEFPTNLGKILKPFFNSKRNQKRFSDHAKTFKIDLMSLAVNFRQMEEKEQECAIVEWFITIY